MVAQLQFEVSWFGGVIHFNLQEALDVPFSLEIYDEADGSFTQLDASDITFGSATINKIPAPSTFAFLGFAGIAAARRRR